MDPVRAATRDALRSQGPLRLDDLARRLRDGGHDVGALADLEQHLFPLDRVEWVPGTLADGRIVDVERLLDGIVVTTRLTDEDIAAGRPLWFSPDLDPLLEWLLEDPLPLATGGHLTAELADGDWELAGPDGWMPGAPGQLLAIRVVDGTAEVTALTDDDLADDASLVERLRIAHDRAREHLRGIEVPDLVIELRARHPRALARPVRPLADLLTEAGLATYGDWVVDADELEELDELDERGEGPLPDGSVEGLAGLADHLADDHGMSPAQIDDVLGIVVVSLALDQLPPDDLDAEERAWIEQAAVVAEATGARPASLGPEDADEPTDLAAAVPRIADALADDLVAQAVRHDLLSFDHTMAGALAVLTRRVATGTRDRVARSNGWWLHAHALEHLDLDGTAVERALRFALEATRDHTGAAADLAWCLDDRGKAGAALGLLVEHDLGDTGWADGLRHWAGPGPTTAGRNDPCPCGSGRKHKVCCAPRNGWPLLDRVDWLFGKLTRFAARPANEAVVGIVAIAGGLDPRELTGLPEDPVVASCVLFEGGLIEDFCIIRGPLLPADELELLRTWAEVCANAYEVVVTDPGVGLTLLDLRSGDRIEVTERTGSRRLQVGQVLLTWVVPYPDGTHRLALGAAPVPVHARESLLATLDGEPDGITLASWYASLSAPPRLQTTDGEPMVLCEVRVAVEDVDAALDTLARQTPLEPTDDPDGDALVLLRDDDAGGRTLVGEVGRADGQLRLQSNAVSRIDRLVALVLDVLPDAKVVDDSRTPVEELADLHRLGGAPGGDPTGVLLEAPEGEELLAGLDDDERAELAAALDAWMADAEERWCDEAIPALGGVTPREAAADPTRRGDLEALLAEMPRVVRAAAGGVGRGMDPDRLRTLLGL